jgi:hypothetical protein
MENATFDSIFVRLVIELMAIDIVSIAPESADSESAFSGGPRTLLA